MSQANVKEELSKAEYEPFLPIERRLVGWSLGIGIALLLVLIAINHLFPVAI